DRLGKPREAARIFRDALAIAPPDESLPPEIGPAVVRARDLVRENAAAFEAFLNESVAANSLSAAERARFEEAKGVLAGTRKVYTQQPVLLHYPRLPAIPFYDRSDFPWIGQIESQTEVIRQELTTLLRDEMPEFRPYLDNPLG